MRYEVEKKFYVNSLVEIESRLRDMGAEFHEPKVEQDTYFAHPCRDFAQTDEAFRMRAVDDVNRVTYKGPKIDPETKTRKEIDLPLPDGEDARVEWAGLFASLGFAPRGFVRKNRRKAFVAWHGRRVEVSLDRIDTLGEFVELELIAEEADLERTKQDIATLADHLGLHRNERRSYLELLLEAGQ